VGFDRLFDELDAVARHATDNYPPHSILKTSEKDYLIELAVAGFKEDELSISVEERTLTVTGQHEDRGREYLHKGISNKKFKKQFRLSEYVEVVGAGLQDGILAIQLQVIVPEEKQPKIIQINNSLENNNETFTQNPQFLQESNDSSN
jgi:molecular chaperone IbpA